jgi:hypothetical protein
MGTMRKANATSFRPGHAGGPGRPRGARSKLTELAIEMLREDFEQHGREVIARVRERKPEVYLASVVSLLPKQAEKIQSPLADISDVELEQLEQHLREVRAKTIERIEELEAQKGTGAAELLPIVS